jgi:outer membrane protein assembly factor BamA
MNKLRTDARKTVGVGIIVPLAIGRIEINYCWPLNARHLDRTQSFQLGISTSFL